MGPHLEIGSLQMRLVTMRTLRWPYSNIMGVLIKGDIWTQMLTEGTSCGQDGTGGVMLLQAKDAKDGQGTPRKVEERPGTESPPRSQKKPTWPTP